MDDVGGMGDVGEGESEEVSWTFQSGTARSGAGGVYRVKADSSRRGMRFRLGFAHFENTPWRAPLNRTLEGKVALLTGAGPGIGRATALRLAEDGADIALTARRVEPLETLAWEVADQTGRRVIPIPTDVKDLDACSDLVAEVVGQLGRVDVLVNNATHPFERDAIADYDWSGYDDSVQLNVKGTMKLCGESAKRMAETGGGSIINIGSLASSSFVAKNMAYCSTKAAMVAASKTLAREVGRNGIRVNVVTPGFTKGENLDRLFETMAAGVGVSPEEISRRLANESELKRHVDPEDIAEAVLFLASDRARNITGIELHVTAGALIQ